MIKTLIFDADGVVLHHKILFSEGLVRDYNVPPEAVKLFFDTDYPACIVGKTDIKEALTKYIPLWNYPGTVDDLLMYWYGDEGLKNEELLQDIVRLRAQGLSCYLGTNNEKYRLAHMLDILGLRNFFDGIFASGHMGYAKPDPAFWQVVHETLGKPSKDEVLFWDDVEKNVASAKEFGFHAELYTDFPSYQEKIKFFLN
jgi:putative hydrolase of the HAD superfamily